jgi:hypothetical protein
MPSLMREIGHKPLKKEFVRLILNVAMPLRNLGDSLGRERS